MTKKEMITIRVTSEQKKNIKKFGGNFTQIFELGYNNFIEKIPEEMEKKAEYYNKMYIQCIDSLNESEVIITKSNNKIDQIVNDYIKTGRPKKPQRCDIVWIQGRCSKRGISPDDVLDRLEGVK